jgi:plastocyanin domain-containing protein
MRKTAVLLTILAVFFGGALLPARAGSPQRVTVKVTGQGFQVPSQAVRAGQPLELTFLRTSPGGCATEVLLPDYGIRKKLPLNQPVVVTIPSPRAGTLSFTCGMKMLKGSLVVR